MNEEIPKLSDLLKTLLPGVGYGDLVSSNVDDIFIELRKKGIQSVRVTSGEMVTIVAFLIANVRDSTGVLKLFQEGKVDKLLGVNLIEE